ncbi:hypothetical protein Avbf_14568 [Armadillidium vulgare]|nr:hypothetical protein Avbf_14568 [Armadillidium vulgare]
MKVTICQEEEYFKKQQWQKFNRQPWELVEQIGKETSANRILVIHQKDENTIRQYFINIDFRLSSLLLNFNLRWKYDQEVLNVYAWRSKIKQEKCFQKCLSGKFRRLESFQKSLGEDAALLYLLPLLLKPKKIALPLKEDTFWKPSKRDMQEAFVIHVQNPEDVLVTYIQKTRETFPNVFEHATICNFAEKRPFEYSSDYYVVLKDILYGFYSPLKAVENCYKVIHAAHARYPFECEDVVFHSKRLL